MKQPKEQNKKLSNKKVGDIVLKKYLRNKRCTLTLAEVLEKLKDDEFYEKALRKKV
jgi:hypothetical protein